MKKITIFIFMLVLALGVVSFAYAKEFNVSLQYNSAQKDEIMKLQSFLFDRGYLKVAPTGRYLSLTKQAVSDFQKDEGIVPAIGIFGPLTRAAANKVSLAKTEPLGATIWTQSISNIDNAATVGLSNAKVISWKTSNYPGGVGVDINLLRKTSDNPNQFVTIRKVKTNTPNDNQETLILQANENTNDLYLEVTCSTTYQFSLGCKLPGNPVKIN